MEEWSITSKYAPHNTRQVPEWQRLCSHTHTKTHMRTHTHNMSHHAVVGGDMDSHYTVVRCKYIPATLSGGKEYTVMIVCIHPYTL